MKILIPCPKCEYPLTITLAPGCKPSEPLSQAVIECHTQMQAAEVALGMPLKQFYNIYFAVPRPASPTEEKKDEK